MSFLFHYYSGVEFVILLFLGTCAGAAADIIKRRRAKGSVVVGEVIPAALVCEGSSYWNKSWSHAAAHVCSPPLRYGTFFTAHRGLGFSYFIVQY